MVGLLMVGLLGMTAIVIDLGQLRSDRRTNKAIADSAVMAGADGVKAGPWHGICDAYRYLLANTRSFSSFGSQSWSNMDSPPTEFASSYASSPCQTQASPFNNSCSGNQASWARFVGVSVGGTVRVEIQSGYTLPDPAFPSDLNTNSDNGVACNQIAVKIQETRPPNFSKIFGAGPRTTTIRSVGRIERNPLEVAALVVLETTECSALVAKANSPSDPAGVIVSSSGNRPGIIQVDSSGTAPAGCGGSARVVEGSALPAGGGPSIIASQSSGSPSIPGKIGIFALETNPAVGYRTPACADPSPLVNPTCVMSPVPVGKAPSGRALLNGRYLSGISALRASSFNQLAQDDSIPPGTNPYAGYAQFTAIGGNCNNASGIFSNVNIWIDCKNGISVSGNLTFSGTGSHLIFQSTIDVKNSSSALVITDPREVFVEGDPATGLNRIGLDNKGTLSINAGGSADCAARHTASRTSVTKLVIKGGGLNSGGGSNLRMCQTAVFMGAGTAMPATPAQSTGTSFNGSVTVGGGGSVDWTAPNIQDTGPASQVDWDQQEDLALWTETAQSTSFTGGSSLHLEGVYAIPNGYPTTFSGNGSGDIQANAQVWTRKLSLTGQGLLRMHPNPDDSTPNAQTFLVR